MNEKTIKRLQVLPRVSVENGITYYIIPQEEYEKLQIKEQEVERLKDKIDYMEGYIKVVENARNDLEREVQKWKHQAELGSDTTDRLSKELKRKEQECEELKEQLKRKEENYQKLLNKSNKYIHNLVDENVQDISNLARQLEQLKTENEKLKKQVCGLRPELKYDYIEGKDNLVDITDYEAW